MARSVELKWEVVSLVKNLAAVRRALPTAAGRALYREAERIMTDSKQNYVPVLTGALRNTGRVGKPEVSGNGATVVLSYGGASVNYALIVHERQPAAGTPSAATLGSAGRGWKYLERPLLAAVKGFDERVGRELMRELAKELRR